MYIENHSLMLDLKIILMTVPVVLRGSDDVWLIINANI